MRENDIILGQAAPDPEHHTNWVRRHPLLSFFALAFAFSWAIMVPMVLDSRGLIAFQPSVPVLILMGYGPTLAALIVTGVVAGRSGIGALLGRLLIWRVGLRWYAVAVLLNAAIILSAMGLFALSGGTVSGLPALGPGLLLDVALTFVVVALINGEEMGWRGFALPRMQSRWSALVASLILGTIEAFFHLPIFLNQGPSAAGGQNGFPFSGFWIDSIAAAILLTWLYNNTHGSLLMAWMFHASRNAWSNILPFPTDGSFFWMLVAVQCLVAAAVVIAFGPRRFSHLPDTAMPFALDSRGTSSGVATEPGARERAA